MGEFRRDQFQRDRPVQRQLRRPVDHAHRSARDERLDPIVTEGTPRCQSFEIRHNRNALGIARGPGPAGLLPPKPDTQDYLRR